MPELTLESLAARVEVLEQLVVERPDGGRVRPKIRFRPPTASREAALQAVRELSQEPFDWDAERAQYECDLKDVERYYS